MPIKAMTLFCVSVREINSRIDYRDVLVLANTAGEAQQLGVDACKAKGLVDRDFIPDTLVYEKENEVFHAS